MAKNLREIPYTELVERVATETRQELDVARIRGAVNDVYVRELPSEEDWSFLLVSSALTLIDDYATGTASVNTQSTTVTFSSDVALDATFVNRRIKFTGNPVVYDITAVPTTTSCTIRPPLAGTTNLTDTSYAIFASIYALAPDFDRWPKNGGLFRYEGGEKVTIPELAEQEYYQEFSAAPATPERCRLVQFGTDGLAHVELIPPPNAPDVLGNEYYRRLLPMRESTAGLITVDAGSTQVVGGVDCRFTEMSTGSVLRVDAFGKGADSEWYRVVAIAHDSALTLQTAFGVSAATSANYTLSDVPQLPVDLHMAIYYGAMKRVLADQTDPMYAFADSQHSAVLHKAKRRFKSRDYSATVPTYAEAFDYRR